MSQIPLSQMICGLLLLSGKYDPVGAANEADKIVALVKSQGARYPDTRMTGDDLHKVYCAASGSVSHCMVQVANAAIHRAIEDGDVILPNTLREVL